MKSAIIFGATGQDGYYLSKLLLGKDYTVVAVKRRASTNNAVRIESLATNPKYHIIEGDVSDMMSVVNVFKYLKQIHDNDIKSVQNLVPIEVYNLAAQSHVATSFNQPSYTFDVNTKGVLNILEYIKDYRDSYRFYQASTSEMFGSKVSHKAGINEYHTDISEILSKKYVGVKLADAYQSENTPFAPMSPYAVSKLAAHQLVNNYRKAYGIHGSSGVLFNHESHMRGDNFVTKKITNFIRDYKYKYERGQTLPELKLGNLSAYRDFGYAGDYVEAMWLMLQQQEPDDYVIATGKSVSIQYFLDRVIELSDTDEMEIRSHISISQDLMRPSEVDYLRGDASKARKALGWKPKVDLHQLILNMLNNND